MAAEITMPQLSDTMTEGTLVKWRKNEGDAIKEGEILADIETDKATMEMESFEAGVLAIRDVAEGQQVKVGSRLAVLATGGEDVDAIRKQYGAGASAAAKSTAPAKSTAKSAMTAKSESEVSTASPAAVAVAEETTAAPEPAESSVQALPAAASPADAHQPQNNGHRLSISPLAKRIASQHSLDWSSLTGSGPNGRIIQRDVLAAIEGGSQLPASSSPAASAAPAAASATASAPAVAVSPTLPARVLAGQKEVIELTKIRQVIANRLQSSKVNIPHFYEAIDIETDGLAALREKMNKQLEKQKIRISIADFIAKALAGALLAHPNLNATYDGKATLTRYGDVNLGIAVSLPGGLIVPVLRGVNHMGLVEIRQRTADLIDRARAQKLKQDEMTGATFTVSNLGTMGIREFTAIINPPEVGILAIGAAEGRAVVRNGQIVPRTMMTVTLSADHRIVDGAAAAEFLQTLKSNIEDPAMLLL